MKSRLKNKHSDGWSEGGEARSKVLVRDQQNLIGLIDKIHVEHDGDGVRGIWWSSLHIPRLHVSVWKPGWVITKHSRLSCGTAAAFPWLHATERVLAWRSSPSLLAPPPTLALASSYKRKGFFFFYESDTRLTVKWINRTSHSCFSRDVAADVTRKCVLAFWKQIVWFLITLSCEHTDLIRPWFYFLSTPPNLPDTPGSSQAFFPGRIIAVCNLRQCILEETNTSRIIQKKEFLVEFFESNQVIFIHIAQKWAPWSLAKDGETSRQTTDQQHRYNNHNRL